MTDRILTPIIALGLAFLVWMYSRSRDVETFDAQVPVEVELHSAQVGNYELDDAGPRSVPISFSGPPSRVRELRRMLRQGEVPIKRTVTVPEEHLEDNEHTAIVRIDPAQVPAPPGVTPLIIEAQNRLVVTMRRIVEKQLPVRFVNDNPDRVKQEIIEPSVVTVRGPKQILAGLDHISTQYFTLPDKPGATQPLVVDTPVVCPLITEVNGKPIRPQPNTVQVRFTLEPRQSVKELTDVTVHFLCPANFPYRPEFTNERAGKISLRVRGPSGEDRPRADAYVDLTSRKFGPGLHAEEPLRIQLPPGYQIIGEPPRLSSFRLVPLESPAKPPEGNLRGQ